jgi:hypothetical protein
MTSTEHHESTATVLTNYFSQNIRSIYELLIQVQANLSEASVQAIMYGVSIYHEFNISAVETGIVVGMVAWKRRRWQFGANFLARRGNCLAAGPILSHT